MEALAAELLPRLLAGLGSAPAARVVEEVAASVAYPDTDYVTLPDDEAARSQYCHEQGWTDGLPIVPPTEERIAAMLRHTHRSAGEILGRMAPRWAAATVELVAANAVMAGCKPEYFPVVLAAVEAVMDPDFNLSGVTSTTHPCGPLVIVHGPIAAELGLNGRGNCFGGGRQANAAIGRALNLCLLNIGGGIPEAIDKATMGQPGKYTACIAENEADSPWEHFLTGRGTRMSGDAVTVVAAEAPHNVNDHGSTSGIGVLTQIAGTMATSGNNCLYWQGEAFVFISPEHARTIARDGFTRQDVQSWLFEHARIPVNRFSPEQLEHFRGWAGNPPDYVEDGLVRLVRSARDIQIMVAGGPGKHSMWAPSFGLSYSVTKPIRR